MLVTCEQVHIVIPPSKTPRSKGMHVSSIIKCIAQETGVLAAEWCEELRLIEITPSTKFLDPDIALRVCIGLAWEEWYIPNVLGAEGVVDHPGEYYYDGIYMSPDAEELSTIIIDRQPRHILRIHEVKTTAKSTNTVGETAADLQGQFMWLAQIKAYCKGAKTRFADLHVLFRYGDYSRPYMKPVLKRYRFEFTQEEIDDNWSLITGYRDIRMQIELGE